MMKMSSLSLNSLTLLPFHKLDLTFPSHTFTMITGANRSGKTQLIKALSTIVPTNEAILFNKAYIESIPVCEIYKKIHVFLGEEKWPFIFKTVEEEIRFPLENLKYSSSEIKKKTKQVIAMFGLSKVLQLNPNTVSKYMKTKILLAVLLVSEPEILLLDDPLKGLMRSEKKEILQILHYYHQQGMSIIMTTSSLEETIMIDISKLIVLYQGQVLKEGKVLTVLQDDSLLNKIGLKLPFMVDLSVKLKYYNLLDDIILDPESLVDVLWK